MMNVRSPSLARGHIFSSAETHTHRHFIFGPFFSQKRVKHKNIIEAIACVEDAGEQFLIFEMADEGDL